MDTVIDIKPLAQDQAVNVTSASLVMVLRGYCAQALC